MHKWKRILPVISVGALAVAITGFLFVSGKMKTLRLESVETRRTVDAAMAELQALRPASLEDPGFRRALETFSRERSVVYVWLIKADGKIAYSNSKRADLGSVDEYATEETRRLLSELPKDFLAPQQRIALLAASAIQSEGEHNDVFRQMLRPLRAGNGDDLGFIGVSYDAASDTGAFPGLMYAVALFLIPSGLLAFGLALAWWVFIDAKERGEKAWIWTMFVLLGNVFALFAYLLTRRNSDALSEGR